MNEANLIYKLAFKFIPNIGTVHAKTLISYCGGIEEVFKAKKSKLLKIPGIGEKKVNDLLKSDALKKAEHEYEKIKGKDISLVFYLDEDYPKRLRNFHNSPLLLYIKGNKWDSTKRTVAIIGTRRPTQYGILECQKMVEALQEFDVTILSGLAYGIDTNAHRKSVELSLRTYGILGNGIQTIYPATNRRLAAKMLEHGGLISEFEMDAKPDRENFPMRNRIIAGLADAVIVVESDIKGGSIITAEIANEYNKDVFAIPGMLHQKMSSGCNHLIKTHKANLLTSAKDIGYIMGWEKTEKPVQMTLGLELLTEEKQILSIIKDNKQISIDQILYKSSIKLSNLSSTLLNLEFKGLIKSLPGKNYILS